MLYRHDEITPSLQLLLMSFSEKIIEWEAKHVEIKMRNYKHAPHTRHHNLFRKIEIKTTQTRIQLHICILIPRNRLDLFVHIFVVRVHVLLKLAEST